MAQYFPYSELKVGDEIHQDKSRVRVDTILKGKNGLRFKFTYLTGENKGKKATSTVKAPQYQFLRYDERNAHEPWK